MTNSAAFPAYSELYRLMTDDMLQRKLRTTRETMHLLSVLTQPGHCDALHHRHLSTTTYD